MAQPLRLRAKCSMLAFLCLLAPQLSPPMRYRLPSCGSTLPRKPCIRTPCSSSAWATSTSSFTTTRKPRPGSSRSPSPPATANARSRCAVFPITLSKATSAVFCTRDIASPSASRWRTLNSPKRSSAAKSRASCRRARRSTRPSVRSATTISPQYTLQKTASASHSSIFRPASFAPRSSTASPRRRSASTS